MPELEIQKSGTPYLVLDVDAILGQKGSRQSDNTKAEIVIPELHSSSLANPERAQHLRNGTLRAVLPNHGHESSQRLGTARAAPVAVTGCGWYVPVGGGGRGGRDRGRG